MSQLLQLPHEAPQTLSDGELHATVRRLTARSNVALADLLAHLGEVESRGIHRNRACATLYTYCLYELRMSEDAAFRRAKAARLVHQFPDLRGAIARGEIHLTGLLMIAPCLGGERHAEVLERARFRSKREISRLMAELDPKPEVPPRIEAVAPAFPRARTLAEGLAGAMAGPVRNLPEGDRPADWVEGAGESIEPDGDEERVAAADRALESAWQARHEAHPGRPLRYKVQFTASQEYVDLLEEAFDLLGCRKKAASMPEVQLRALRELVERLRKRRRGAPGGETRAAPARRAKTPKTPESTSTALARQPETRETPASTAPARLSRLLGPGPAHGRYVPASVRRAVWSRDGARCAYVDDRGRRCAETRGLEVHHREAYAFDGPATVDNLELRCRAHNTLAAEQDFGRQYMDWVRGVDGAGAKASEP